jgi:signal transduction histidine kinase
VRIRVADDGPGVPRELRARIFEPGFSTKESGWGIGLSLAQRIIEENHSGRLVLAPSEKGATFDVILQG